MIDHSVSSRAAKSLVAALTVAAMFAGSADAVEAGVSKRVKNACAGDAKRHCSAHKSGSPAMEYCMEAKGKYLSRECKRALEDDGIIPRGYFN
jgi:hypothetical protein